MIRGRAWVFGDNIDTDVIIPARYLNTSRKEELKKYCFVDLLPEFPASIREGDIIVAGYNFGCGSSREHAPIAIKEAGIAVVIAKSFARIFYRNALNIGLPLLEVKEGLDTIATGETLEVDLEKGIVRIPSRGYEIHLPPISGLERDLLEAGGLLPYTKKRISRGESLS